ncbi:MAG: glycosyltransferase family 39 protein [Candidatus Eisenbacteria bacterium]|nr:glycosyltransferase family 39 protein [Candidatus Eisenbacteria bacterium]
MTKPRWLGLTVFLFFLSVYLLTTGGGIVSSDGNTMFLLTAGIVERGTISIPYGNGYPGPDGRLYPKAGIGQAVLAAPFYMLGRAVYNAFGFGEVEKGYVLRFVTATLEPFAAAVAVLLLLYLCFCLGYSVRTSLALTLAFGLTTPIWVYSKSFLTEPLTTALILGSVLALLTFKRSGRRRHLLLAGVCAAACVLTKYAMALAVVPVIVFFAGSCLPMKHRSSELSTLSFVTRLLAFGIPLLVGVGVAFWYNHARFGSIFATGYGAETSIEGFGTPLLVGLYGQLFSSGKSVFLYAPVLLASLAGFVHFRRKFGAEALLFLSVFVLNLLFYSKFLSWAGDGSWGPRYVIPFVPLLLVPVGSLLSSEHAGRLVWGAFVFLALVGFAVQLGGVGIYFGSYLREVGEYPYTREFTDPLFLSKSHFVPNYSPVYGHWKMLARNVGLHAEGKLPSVRVRSYEGREVRLPLDEASRKELLTGLDFWFTYLRYAGKWRAQYWAVVAFLAAVAAASGWFVFRNLSARRQAAT